MSFLEFLQCLRKSVVLCCIMCNFTDNINLFALSAINYAHIDLITDFLILVITETIPWDEGLKSWCRQFILYLTGYRVLRYQDKMISTEFERRLFPFHTISTIVFKSIFIRHVCIYKNTYWTLIKYSGDAVIIDFLILISLEPFIEIAPSKCVYWLH